MESNAAAEHGSRQAHLPIYNKNGLRIHDEDAQAETQLAEAGKMRQAEEVRI